MTAVFRPVAFQENVYCELKEMARDFFDYDWRHLSIQPRQNPLIAGSTGTGKTFLVGCLARDLGLPILSLEFSGWIVTGANSRRGGAHTLTTLYQFISTHDRGIIFADEIEKLGDANVESDWTKTIQLELFSVLDKRLIAGVTDADDDAPRAVPFCIRAPHLERKFKTSFFVCGAGAWQSLWDTRNEIGFRATHGDHKPSQLSHQELVTMLRPEILNRFNSSVLWVPPLGLSDYESLLREAIQRLPAAFGPILAKEAAATIREAVATQRGFRWVQELIACAIRQLRTSATLAQMDTLRERATEAISGLACFEDEVHPET